MKTHRLNEAKNLFRDIILSHDGRLRPHEKIAWHVQIGRLNLSIIFITHVVQQLVVLLFSNILGKKKIQSSPNTDTNLECFSK